MKPVIDSSDHRAPSVSAKLSDSLCRRVGVPPLSAVCAEELSAVVDLSSADISASASTSREPAALDDISVDLVDTVTSVGANEAAELAAMVGALHSLAFADALLVIAHDRLLRDTDRSAAAQHVPSAAQV